MTASSGTSRRESEYLFILSSLLVIFSILDSVVFSRSDPDSSSVYRSLFRYASVFVIMYLFAIKKLSGSIILSQPKFSYTYPFLLLISSGLLTYIYAHDNSSSRLLAMLGYLVIFVIFYPIAKAGESDKEGLVRTLAIVFILYSFGQVVFLFSPDYYYDDRFKGLTDNPNQLATILFIGWSLIYIAYRLEKKGKLKATFLVSLGIITFLLRMAASKSALLSIVILLLLSIRIKHIVYILGASFIVVFYIIYFVDTAVFFDVVERFIDPDSNLMNYLRLDRTSLFWRLDIGKRVVENYLVGLDRLTWMFGNGLTSYASNSIPLDNTYLLTVYEQGMVGLIFYAVMLIKVSSLRDISMSSKGVNFFAANLCLSMMVQANFESTLFLGINVTTVCFILMYIMSFQGYKGRRYGYTSPLTTSPPR